jgi:hypothetical protein
VGVNTIAIRDYFGGVYCEFWWGAALTKPINVHYGVRVLLRLNVVFVFLRRRATRPVVTTNKSSVVYPKPRP